MDKQSSAELYLDQVIGFGAYGIVCKAKSGQLPCVAKLLHCTLFVSSDPGKCELAEKFEKECQVLSTIKHPNIVQYLGTTRDPKSRRLALLIELMDESLTNFLKHSPGPIAYHIQLNICHDIAIALSYLHSENIIHRDLSSNNVLLYKESNRAKVSDFGMAKVLDARPSMATTTLCPGTLNYMPPEAITSPSHYTCKLDCFSFGVLAIQIVTRNLPNPGAAHTSVSDPKYPSGRILIQRMETERRKNDIDLISSDHSLLPIIIGCLQNCEEKRPSAEELCKRLEELKGGELYVKTKQQIKEDALKLQGDLLEKKEIIEREKEANRERERVFQKEKSEFQKEITMKEKIIEHIAKDQHVLLRERGRAFTMGSGIGSKIRDRLLSFRAPPVLPDPTELAWTNSRLAPQQFLSGQGSAVADHTTAYFSYENTVYSFEVSSSRWNRLPLCQHKLFGMAIIKEQLTTIGGCEGLQVTNSLSTLQPGRWFGRRWMSILPPMPTGRIKPASVITQTNHLVVAGGQEIISNPRGLLDVEVLSIDTSQWSVAKSLPLPICSLQMTACGKHLYILKDTSFYSCLADDLVKSSYTEESDSSCLWAKFSNMPLQSSASVVTLGEHVVAL